MLNQTIYFLSDYNWQQGTVISEGPKNYKIYVPAECWHSEYTVIVPKDKCAAPDELVCVVWEMWKGRNGRGGYRVERELYPEKRVPGKKIHYQHVGGSEFGRVSESQHSILA